VEKLKEYALITGASGGIGKAMVILLAQKGYSLLLISRSAHDLGVLAQEIRDQYQVSVEFLATDLSHVNAAEEVATWCHSVTPSLTILINNAGYGLWGDFEQLNLAEQQNMLRLNISTVTDLTHHLLPLLKKQEQTYILNVSSTAAYQAVPTLALYAASKAFILSYSRALRYELKDSVVSVSCLCPGPTATGFADRAGMSALADLADKFNMQPAEVAVIGIKGMFGKKTEIIPGFLNQLSAFGARHLPKSLIERITAKLYHR
jgi:short-subunit dehydrogenase